MPRGNPILASWQTIGKHFKSKMRRRRRPNPGFMVSAPGFPVTVPLGRRIGRLAAKVRAATLHLVCRASLFVSHSRSLCHR